MSKLTVHKDIFSSNRKLSPLFNHQQKVKKKISSPGRKSSAAIISFSALLIGEYGRLLTNYFGFKSLIRLSIALRNELSRNKSPDTIISFH